MTGAAEPIFLPGEVAAGRFRVIRLLGQGGMAQVFEAADLELGQNVAIKVIRPELATDPRARDLLRREVLLARRVTHPNVCRIFDVFQHSAAADGAHDGTAAWPEGPGGSGSSEGLQAANRASTLVLVMELVRGETLAQRLARGGPLTAAESLPIIRQLAAGLDAAHGSQVVHGDFKCGNVILEPSPSGPRAVVTDFGLAQHSALAGGCAGGTTAYMAPEQLVGEVTPASDLYALGVVIHEMVVGQRPLPARKGRGRIDFRTALMPLAVRSSRPADGPRPPTLPPRWRVVVGSCLAPSARDRPTSAVEVARRLAAGLPARPLLSAGSAGRQLVMGAAMVAFLMVCLGLISPGGARSEHSPGAAVLGASVLGAAIGSFGSPSTTAPGGEDAASVRRLAVAVGAVQGPSTSPRYAWLPAALGHMIVSDLAAPGQIEVFQLPSVLTAGPRLPTPHADLATVTSFRLPPGADQDQDPTFRVELELKRVASGEVLASLAESARVSQLAAVAARLGDRLRAGLDLGETTPQDRAATRALWPRTLQAEGLYAQGLARLLRGRTLEAYTAFEQASAADPRFPMSHAALARVCADLGYGVRARAEALRAAYQPYRLPGQEQLEIAAISRRVNNDLPGAAGFFGTLWHLAPHRFDYGLQLAETQLEGGRSHEAIETLTMLRARGFDITNAASVDSLEARARIQLSELERALAAAGAAEAEAQQTGDDFALAGALIEEADARVRKGDVEHALEALTRAQGLFRRLGFRPGEAEVLAGFAFAAERAGSAPRALALYERALAIFQQTGFIKGAATVLRKTAVIQHDMGKYPQAEQLLDRALVGFRSLGDRLGEAAALNDLALAQADSGDYQKAKRNYADAESLDAEIGNREGLAAVLTNLALLEVSRADLNVARIHFQESLGITHELGLKDGEAIGHINVGSVRAVEGNLRAARPEFFKALRLAREANRPYVETHALMSLGRLLTQQGKFALAEGALRQALALERQDAELVAIPETLFDLTRIQLCEARFGAAEASIRQRLEAVRKLGHDPEGDVQAAALLALAQAGQGRLEEARRNLDRAQRSAGKEAEDSLYLTISSARLALAGKRPDEAARQLEDVLQRFSSSPNPDLLFEARFLLGSAELDRGRAATACPDLRSLAEKAQHQGFFFVAHEAQRLLTSKPGCGAPAARHG